MDIQQGISRAVCTSERGVASLDFHQESPHANCEAPDLDVFNLNGFKLTAVSNFRLLHANLHARKNKERAIRLSPHIAQREDNIAGANMHLGIQTLLNKLQPEVHFEQYDFGLPELAPTTPADHHTYMTEMLQIHFEAQPTPVLDSHDGSLQWKDILTGTTKTIRDRFQSEYPALHRRPTGHSPRLLASLSPRPQPPPGQCRPAISSLRSFTQRLVIHRGRRPSGCCNISIFRTGPRIWSK